MCNFTIDSAHFLELEKFLSSFKGKGEAVRMTVGKTGVEFRMSEDGILGSCKLPIMATGSEDMYIKYSVLDSLISVSKSKSVKIEVKDENLIQASVDGVNLNLSPEFFNGIAFSVPNLDEPVAQVEVNSDVLANIVKKVQTQASADAHVTPIMKIGAQWRYGTSTNITLFNTDEFNTVDWSVSSLMLKFIGNVTKVADNVTMTQIHGEFESYLVLQSNYTTYWTTLAGIEPIDISEFIEQDIETSAAWNKSEVISSSLDKLQIPLIGSVDEPHVIVTLNDGSTKLLVTDLANRVSFDLIEMEGQEKHDDAIELNFNAFANVMKKLENNLPFTVSVKETCIIFTQGGNGEAGTLTSLITRYI